jgi:hypothetical protein
MKGADKFFYQLAPITIGLIFLSLIYLLYSVGPTSRSSISGGIILVALFIAAFFVESKYLPFLGVLPNLFLLYALVGNSKEPVPLILEIYLFAGIVLGLLAYMLYHLRDIKGRIYEGTNVLYSLKTIFPIYLSYFLFGSFTHPFIFYSFVLFAVISWAFYIYIGA